MSRNRKYSRKSRRSKLSRRNNISRSRRKIKISRSRRKISRRRKGGAYSKPARTPGGTRRTMEPSDLVCNISSERLPHEQESKPKIQFKFMGTNAHIYNL